MDSSTCDVFDVSCWLTAFFTELKLFAIGIYGWFLDGASVIINLIPLPDFLQDMPSYTLPAEVAYYAQHLQLTAGIAIVSTAFGLRFLVRRLPFIG